MPGDSVKKGAVNLLFLAILLVTLGCDNTSPICDQTYTLNLEDKCLWNETVKPCLEDPLWLERDIYDAGHFLMVPLHAAFLNDQELWQNQFAQHFQRFVKAYPEHVAQGRLNRLHYLYLASRFLVLAVEKGRQDLIPPQLPSILYAEIKDLWQDNPAWEWNRDPFPGGIRARVLWKLNHKDVKQSYYRAIIDEELFLFAIAANLHAYERVSGLEDSPMLTDILDVAYRVFQQEVVLQEDGGWLFQPGIWTDHHDYAYAGRKEKAPGMEPLPVPGMAWDSSHSHRFPLWLTSLAGAYSPGSNERRFYNHLKAGLEKHLFNEVLVPRAEDSRGYRMRNFMDGRNGVYRWNYQTLQESDGYGPYQLSRTLLLGWRVFLGSDSGGTSRILEVYRDIASEYPYVVEVLALYKPKTTRESHPLISNFTSGFRELIVRLAGKLELNYAQDSG